MTATKPRRAKNPRTIVLRVLRDMAAANRRMVARWNVRASDYDWDAPREPGANVPRIKRRPEDFPENQIDAWKRLAEDAYQMSKAFQSIHGYALDRITDLEAARAAGYDEETTR
jgi:hypothetical protein